jgi:hypothetical protein
MAISLKTEGRSRYLLYRNDDARLMAFASQEAKQMAIDAGKRYTAAAYPEVWAKDADLVSRVRQFLGDNLPWHDRLTKNGAGLNVVRTLMDMVRGGSVVVIVEDVPALTGLGSPPPAAASFWGVEYYDPPRYASVRERYEAQIAELEASATPWAVIESMNDAINAKFMHAAVLVDPVGMLPIFARAGWVSKYGLPDLSNWGEVDEAEGGGGNFAKDVLFDDASDDRTQVSLSDADPFEYVAGAASADVEELAASTGNPEYAAKMLGYDRTTFGDMIHVMKPENGLGPADNVIWHDNGDVYFNGKLIDNMHNY